MARIQLKIPDEAQGAAARRPRGRCDALEVVRETEAMLAEIVEESRP